MPKPSKNPYESPQSQKRASATPRGSRSPHPLAWVLAIVVGLVTSAITFVVTCTGSVLTLSAVNSSLRLISGQVAFVAALIIAIIVAIIVGYFAGKLIIKTMSRQRDS